MSILDKIKVEGIPDGIALFSIEDHYGKSIFIFRKDGTGMVRIYIDSNKYVYITDLNVTEEKRGLGIGSGMINMAEKTASKLGYDVVRLKCLNERLKKWYESMGYQEIKKESTGYHEIRKRFKLCYYMEKNIQKIY
jgi:ribosomal protein S18 acetylase RimI-like enzyme